MTETEARKIARMAEAYTVEAYDAARAAAVKLTVDAVRSLVPAETLPEVETNALNAFPEFETWQASQAKIGVDKIAAAYKTLERNDPTIILEKLIAQYYETPEYETLVDALWSADQVWLKMVADSQFGVTYTRSYVPVDPEDAENEVFTAAIVGRKRSGGKRSSSSTRARVPKYAAPGSWKSDRELPYSVVLDANADTYTVTVTDAKTGAVLHTSDPYAQGEMSVNQALRHAVNSATGASQNTTYNIDTWYSLEARPYLSAQFPEVQTAASTAESKTLADGILEAARASQPAS